MYTTLSTNQQAEKRQWIVAWETMGIRSVSLRAARPVFTQFDSEPPPFLLMGDMKLALCPFSEMVDDYLTEVRHP